MKHILDENFKLIQKDIGEFKNIKVGVTKFKIDQYEIEGVGNLSIMHAEAMLGLMKMDSIIITPLKKDAPLFSYDYIHAMGNETLIVEMYDTFVEEKKSYDSLLDIKKEFSSIKEHNLGEHWYDNIKLEESFAKKGKKISKPVEEMTNKYFEAYAQILKDAPEVDEVEKSKKSYEYVEGLIKHGGPSTDVFIKKFGKEKTIKLYKEVLFGINI